MLAPVLLTRAALEHVPHYQSTWPTEPKRIGFRFRHHWRRRVWFVTTLEHDGKHAYWESRMAIPIDARPEQIRSSGG